MENDNPIQVAIASLCEDITKETDSDKSYKMAEAVKMLDSCSLAKRAPSPTWRQALHIISKTCAASSTCDVCPMTAWCEKVIKSDDPNPAEWELPEND